MVNVLAVFSHPDDETILAGGTLALIAKSGAPVHFLCATRGEGGEMGDPPLCEREQLGGLREQEMACAVQSLGGSSLIFLDYQDPVVGQENTLYAYTENLLELAEQIAGAAVRLGVQQVITHGSSGEYGHPAHVLTHRACVQAVRQLNENSSGRMVALYTIDAYYPQHPRPYRVNKDDPADLVLDITPVLEHKIRAALCHRSQHSLFVRRASERAGRPLTVPEVIIALESLHRYRDLPGQPADSQLLDLLQAYRWVDGKS
jgi:N-acetylglucosamine malate deacetylase 2